VAFLIFLSGDSRKISLKLFEQEIKKIFEIFSIMFDQKLQNHVICFFKEDIKNMWSPSRKVEVATLKGQI
jgi:hypothetical protein